MAFTYIGGVVEGYAAASGTSLSCSSTLNVAAGDVLVTWVSWEDGLPGTVAVSDGGSNSFTMQSSSNFGGNYGQFGIITSAAANASATFTFTNSSARAYRTVFVMQFRPDAGETVTLDQISTTATGTGTSLASSAITTTGTDEIVIGAGKWYASGTSSAKQIGGVNADGSLVPSASLAGMWYRILAATMSSGTATATIPNAAWIGHIISLKSEAGAGGSTFPLYAYAQQ